MESPKYKAINFDLDTRKMRQHKKYPVGYTEIKRSLLQLGFTHRQWSGYTSKSKLVSSEVIEIVEKLVKAHPWLSDCANKFDVTDIGKQFDLMDVVRNEKKQVDDTKFIDDDKNDKGDKPDDGAVGGVAPKSPTGPQNGPSGSSDNARPLKNEDTKEKKSGDTAATMADKYRMTQDYQDSVTKYGKKTTERLLSQTTKNMTTQGKAKSTKAKAPKSSSNSSGK
ncbi:MAG: hypothetical protein ACI4MO_00110 [Christensenellales bacterium]